MATDGRRSGAVDIYAVLFHVMYGLLAGSGAITAKLIMDRIGSLEKQVSSGILPRAEERIRSLEDDVMDLESRLRDHEINGR